MRRSPDTFKHLSAALSERLNTANDVQQAKQILEETLSRFAEQTPAGRAPRNDVPKATGKEPGIARIGVWEAKVEDGELWFVRPPESDPANLWADVERIGPKRDKLRVVLVGESVARGYLIDPYFNLATALQTLLNSEPGPDVEVVDLARNGLTFEGLEKLLQSSLALQPDAYVIFAGNNWQVPQPELLNLDKLATLLHEAESWAPVRTYVDDCVRNQVRGFVERLGKLSARHRIPVVFIIPDFNLADWVLEDRTDPLVTSDMTRRRLDLIGRAEGALAKNDLQQAVALANQLIELENGSYATGFEILAKCELSRGNFCKARGLKWTARDLVLTYHSVRTPICYSITQDVLREQCPKHGITIVDLPHRFAECLPEALTDRRFFFDYVHLNAKGIRLAAASAVEKLLPLLGKEIRSWPELDQFEFDIEPRGLALAHFAAACANAVNGQAEELVEFHCSEALRHDSQISEVMETFLDWHIRLNRSSCVKKFEDVLGKKGYYLLKFPRNLFRSLRDGALHPPLIQAITAALAASVPEIKDRLDLMLKQEHGVTSAGIDLLLGLSTEVTQAPLESQWRQETCYFRSYREKSCFYVICNLPRPLHLRLVCRILNVEALTKPVELLVNGVSVTNFKASTNWHAWEGTVAANLLHSGINSIELSWPEIRQTRAERVAEVVKGLKSAMIWEDFKDIYSAYGEIHEFRAMTA